MIPKKAKRIFKGIIFDIYQWEQKLFDGSYQTFEGIKRKPTVQLIPITKDNKIIVLEEEQPNTKKFVGLVGGQVEDYETPKESAKKELLEETGMSFKKLILLEKNSFGGKIVWDSYYFIARDVEKISEPTPEPGEMIKVIELEFEDFIEFTQRDDFRNRQFKNKIFRLIHNKKEFELFKRKIFNKN